MTDTDYDFEELASGGMYAKWEAIGDEVVGRIAAFSIDGGTDFNGDPCPQLVVETTGGNVTINGGQAALRRLFSEYATRLVPTHGVRVRYSGDYETKHGTKGKDFSLAVTPKPVAPVVAAPVEEEPF